jgi:hypothetical protein
MRVGRCLRGNRRRGRSRDRMRGLGGIGGRGGVCDRGTWNDGGILRDGNACGEGRYRAAGTGVRAVRERSRRSLWQYHRRVRPRTGEIVAYAALKVAQRGRVDVQLPLQVGAHLPLHLVDLPQRKHALANYAPGLV